MGDEVEDPARLPEIVQRAFHTAMQGRPGPVVIALPEDVLTEAGDASPTRRASKPAAIWPGQTQMAELQKLLWAAERPVVVFGGGGWNARAGAALTRFAERFDLPLIASFRRSSVVDNDHPNFAGELGLGVNPKLKARVEAADLVLLIGGRMAETPSQSYTLFAIPEPRQALVHVHADAAEIGRVYHPPPWDRRDPAGLLRRAGRPAAAQRDCLGRRDARRARGLSRLERASRRPIPAAVQLGEIMLALRKLAPDAIFANGAGNFAIWPGRFLRFRRFNQQLGPTSGSMGYGVPAAIAAKRADPERIVVAFAGDGDFLMNGQEFATAVQYDLPIVVVVVDNGMYGTIRMHQEREYPGRVSGDAVAQPRFRRSSARLRRPRRDGRAKRRNSRRPSRARWRPASRRSCM